MDVECQSDLFKQFFTHFDVFNQHHKKYKFNIPESDLLDLTEKICHRDIYKKLANYDAILDFCKHCINQFTDI